MGMDIKGKKVAISGFGNVAWGVVRKVDELGGKEMCIRDRVDNPKIAIGVLVENAGWGASYAGPIASLMIEKYLTDTVKRIDLENRMKARCV